MKLYIKSVLSLMVTGLFLMMAVASLDPDDEVPKAKDCEMFPQLMDRSHEFSITVVDNETKLPLNLVDVGINFSILYKTLYDSGKCEFKGNGEGRAKEKFVTNNEGKVNEDFERNYISSEDYTIFYITLSKTGYYTASRYIILKYQNNDISLHFNLLRENKTP